MKYPKIGRTQRKLIDYVRAHPGTTATQAARALGLDQNTVYVSVRTLARHGLLRRRRVLVTRVVASRRFALTLSG